MKSSTRWLALLPVAVTAVVVACRDDTVAPQLIPSDAPQRVLTGSITDEYTAGTPVHGAIFTTTPDGGVVNGNTKYRQKIEVYLDGGPRNANAQAAGLPDGLYVFQVTDPPGKLLLSKDPARCRVVQVDGGVIKGTVDARSIPGLGATSDNWTDKAGEKNRCHIEEGPDGTASVAGQHDTNTDSDPGLPSGGATVQMMPFFDTPNNGGVYKAWITPLAAYVQKRGRITDLNVQTAEVYTASPRTLIGYQPDPGFKSPARNFVKTDNFKVVENPPFIRISKILDGASYTGWPVTVFELIEGAWVGAGFRPTVATFAIPLGTDVQLLACEAELSPYSFVSATVNGISVPRIPAGTPSVPADDGQGHKLVCVSVPGTNGAATIDVVFTNVTGTLRWLKVDGLGNTIRVTPGATFRVRQTAPATTPDFTVTDNDALDKDPDAGEFLVTELPLGTYCVRETVAPAGYLLDPTEHCGIVLSPTSPDGDAGRFVNNLQGRMTGGSGKIEITLDNGDVVTISIGFTIHCDITLSNNVEINWPGNRWHLDKPIDTAVCVDDPAVVPDQPDAPFDTFLGTATGKLNGVDGSKISFTFVDGDGGTNGLGKANDRASLTIKDKNGNTVLSFAGKSIRGNLQAHEDQPHR